MLELTQIRSASGRIQEQIDTLRALGLGKINSSRVIEDNEITRGMIRKVKHIVSVKKIDEE